MEDLTKDNPELREAIAYALREVSIHRPPDAISFVATKLVEWNSKRAKPTPFTREGKDDDGGKGGESDDDDEDDEEDDVRSPEDEEKFEARMRSRQRGRRSVVFAEPVKLDESWTPTVVPKSDAEKDSIREIMSKNILFRTLEGEQLELLIDVMVKKTFKDGEEIITQGAQGDFYYVLQSGTCDIFKDGDLVLQVSFGMGFGELALMYDAPRAATVQATSDVVAWAIDRVSFKQVMMGTTTKKRDLYKSFLEGVDLLSTLTEKERLTISDALQPFTFEAGSDVIVEGDSVADRFYIVEDGELKATKSGVADEVCPRLKRGSYFGEIALVEDRPRAATVTAVSTSKCLAMDRAAFVRLLGPVTDLLKRNMEVYERYEKSLGEA